jgi:mannose/cellobiose epimerase-like protein (N-acyl-D-glucosamine 2-epimerase family)
MNSIDTSAYPSCTAWREHWTNDIAPYWLIDEALGNPRGNFPTYRNLEGKPTQNKQRYARMLARQTYTYFIGYHLTGNVHYLECAKDGLEWLKSKARDPDNGMFFTMLDEHGTPIRSDDGAVKTAQDQAYVLNAFATDYYITRDQESRQIVEDTFELLFQGPFWDKQRGVLFDAMNNELTEPKDIDELGSELVAYLDQLNAYLLLFANQHEEHGADESKWFRKCRELIDIIIDRFYLDEIFWATDINRTQLNKPHIDTGHVLKTYWMIHRYNRLSQRRCGVSIYERLLRNVPHLMHKAAGFVAPDFWGTHFRKDGGIIQRNPDWWVQIEMDQLCADLSIDDKFYATLLNQKANTWLQSSFIDRSRPVRGIREGIRWDNTLHGDDPGWESKCNKWKNGFHETEHCLVLDICSHAITDSPLELFFALPQTAIVDRVEPRPYIFTGQVKHFEPILEIQRFCLHKVKVTFDKIS